MRDKIVEESYDKIASTYQKQRDRFKNDDVLREFSKILPRGAKILDVGCGGEKHYWIWGRKKVVFDTPTPITQTPESNLFINCA